MRAPPFPAGGGGRSFAPALRDRNGPFRLQILTLTATICYRFSTTATDRLGRTQIVFTAGARGVETVCCHQIVTIAGARRGKLANSRKLKLALICDWQRDLARVSIRWRNGRFAFQDRRLRPLGHSSEAVILRPRRTGRNACPTRRPPSGAEEKHRLKRTWVETKCLWLQRLPDKRCRGAKCAKAGMNLQALRRS